MWVLVAVPFLVGGWILTAQPLRVSPPEKPAAIAGSPADNEALELFWGMRRVQQFQATRGIESFHGFQFNNRAAASGVTFTNVVTEDSGKHWIPVHYDHGTAICAADVDLDGALDLFFVNQIGRNGLWRNRGAGKFEDITERAGVGLSDRVCSGAAFADIDNDGDPDLFVSTVRMGNVLFENLGDGRFRDITATAGVGEVAHSSGAVFFDFDLDGLLDLFVANVGVYTEERRGPGGYYRGLPGAFTGHLKPERAERSTLYRNLGGRRFADVSEAMNLVDMNWTGDASACDVNRDGYPDLYVANMQGDDHYYENLEGKRFVDRTERYFPKTPWGAMGIKFFDVNRDDLMDLILVDMHSDMTDRQTIVGRTNLRLDFEKSKSGAWCGVEWTDEFLQGAANNIFGNALFLNRDGGVFEEVSDAFGAETYWPWGVSVGDLNADGYDDVFVTGGMGYGFRYGINSILLNEMGRRFHDAEFVLGIEPRAGGKVDKVHFILDCQGADRDHPLSDGKSRALEVSGPRSSRAAILVDVDDDGDLDIITQEANDGPQWLVSNLSEKKNIRHLKVRLIGTRSNRDGLGASVTVRAGDVRVTRVHDGNSGYLSRSSMPLYFGLGDQDRIDALEIAWPSGVRQIVEGPIAVNALLTVTEPDAVREGKGEDE